MRTTVLRFATLAALGALSIALPAGGPGPQEEFTLARRAKAGDVLRYRIVATTTVEKEELVIEASTTEKVLEVAEGGAITIESTHSDGKLKFMGQELAVEETVSSKAVFSAGGDVVKIEGPEVDGSNYRLANLYAFRYPDKPVKFGDSWERTVTADPATGAFAAKATYTLVGTEKVGSWETAKVQFTYEETEAKPPMTAEGTFWIDLADGAVVRLTLTAQNAPLRIAPEPVAMKTTLTRLPAGSSGG